MPALERIDLAPASQRLLEELRRRRRRIAGGFALGVGGSFFVYMSSLVFARRFLSHELFQGSYVSRAVAVSIGFMLFCLGTTAAYVLVSERWLRPLATELRDRVYRK